METVRNILSYLGIDSAGIGDFITVLVQVLLMIVVGIAIYWIAKKWLAKLIIKLAGKTATTWDDLMFDQRFFASLVLLIAPLVIELFLFTRLPEDWTYFALLDKIIKIWITLALIFMVSAVLDGMNRIYETYPMARHRPLKVFIQVFKIFLYCAGFIVVISLLLNKSPETLLVGMGAFAAVLMLVFKDAILGFVAGVQLIANKMVRIGDWIVMPECNADGEVQEINLTTVKVQNWDKTISTIPTYKLVSESFTNWRGMWEAGGRRIKRSVNIDIHSIHYLTREEIEELKKSSLLKSYMEQKEKELADYNADRGIVLDEKRMTNIGTFREYMEAWLSANPDINLGLTHMVRQLQPGPTGVPLEIYCFSARQTWVDYERVQADIFDHVFAVLPLFGLRAYEYAGREMA